MTNKVDSSRLAGRFSKNVPEQGIVSDQLCTGVNLGMDSISTGVGFGVCDGFVVAASDAPMVGVGAAVGTAVGCVEICVAVRL